MTQGSSHLSFQLCPVKEAARSSPFSEQHLQDFGNGSGLVKGPASLQGDELFNSSRIFVIVNL